MSNASRSSPSRPNRSADHPRPSAEGPRVAFKSSGSTLVHSAGGLYSRPQSELTEAAWRDTLVTIIRSTRGSSDPHPEDVETQVVVRPADPVLVPSSQAEDNSPRYSSDSSDEEPEAPPAITEIEPDRYNADYLAASPFMPDRSRECEAGRCPSVWEPAPHGHRREGLCRPHPLVPLISSGSTPRTVQDARKTLAIVMLTLQERVKKPVHQGGPTFASRLGWLATALNGSSCYTEMGNGEVLSMLVQDLAGPMPAKRPWDCYRSVCPHYSACRSEVRKVFYRGLNMCIRIELAPEGHDSSQKRRLRAAVQPCTRDCACGNDVILTIVWRTPCRTEMAWHLQYRFAHVCCDASNGGPPGAFDRQVGRTPGSFILCGEGTQDLLHVGACGVTEEVNGAYSEKGGRDQEALLVPLLAEMFPGPVATRF